VLARRSAVHGRLVTSLLSMMMIWTDSAPGCSSL
jgi:hypothetical protein